MSFVVEMVQMKSGQQQTPKTIISTVQRGFVLVLIAIGLLNFLVIFGLLAWPACLAYMLSSSDPKWASPLADSTLFRPPGVFWSTAQRFVVSLSRPAHQTIPRTSFIVISHEECCCRPITIQVEESTCCGDRTH